MFLKVFPISPGADLVCSFFGKVFLYFENLFKVCKEDDKSWSNRFSSAEKDGLLCY